MARFFGAIGYNTTTETRPGVWEESIVEHNYYGDILRNTRRLEKADGVNDNINVNNIISIVADPFAFENFFAISYIKWMGTLWKVTNVEVQRPRLILTIGGVYNGAES